MTPLKCICSADERSAGRIFREFSANFPRITSDDYSFLPGAERQKTLQLIDDNDDENDDGNVDDHGYTGNDDDYFTFLANGT